MSLRLVTTKRTSAPFDVASTRAMTSNMFKTPSFRVTLRYNREAHAHAREQVKLVLNQNLSAE